MKVRELIKPNDLDLKGKVVKKLRGIYDKANLNIGAKSTLSTNTYVRQSTATGVIYGRRTIVEK